MKSPEERDILFRESFSEGLNDSAALGVITFNQLHVKHPKVSFDKSDLLRENFESFWAKLNYFHQMHDNSWADSSESESEDSDDEIDTYDNIGVVSNVVQKKLNISKAKIGPKLSREDYLLREMELRRVLLFRIGKYELEEGEVLYVGEKCYYE